MPLPVLSVPKYFTTLPNSKEEIEYRPFLVKEEKILLMSIESKDEQEMKTAIETIVTNCTGLDPKLMALVDIEYIFLKLRIVSKGATAEYTFKCSECNVENTKSADLNDVQVINEDYDTTVKLTSDIGLTMKAPSYELANEVSKEMTTKDVFTVITESIDLIYDGDEVHKAKDYSKEELNDFIEGFTDAQFELVRKYFENMPSLQLDVDFSCSACKKENVMKLKGINDFLV